MLKKLKSMVSIHCKSSIYKAWQITKRLSTTIQDAYFSDELQHSLDTFHHPLRFTTNQHHPVC